MVTWPDTLPPRSNTNGFADAVSNPRLMTRTDTGPGKVRRRSPAAPRQQRLTFTLHDEQRDRLVEFWTVDTKGGSLPFAMPSQRYHDAVLCDETFDVLTDEDGEVLTGPLWELCQFAEPPALTVDNGVWRASVTLTILP